MNNNTSILTRTFPQNINYANGFKTGPSFLSNDEAYSFYKTWKKKYLVSCKDSMYRVGWNQREQTSSEGIGYGMMLTAYFGEKEYFDGLYTYYEQKRGSRNFMPWLTTCDGIIDSGSATDGDIDTAFALIVAYNQWERADYLENAKAIINRIKEHLTVYCDTEEGHKVITIKPGVYGEPEVAWGGAGLTDLSYYMPAEFRVFAEVTGDAFWNDLADDTYYHVWKAAHEVTGLVPDWQSVNGVPSGEPDSGRKGSYWYDASRVPWRLGVDYLWYGTEDAKKWCKKVVEWIYNNIGIKKITDEYQLNGDSHPDGYHVTAFVGGFAVGAQTFSQDLVNEFSKELKSIYDYTFFCSTLKVLYALSLTGNFWRPSV